MMMLAQQNPHVQPTEVSLQPTVSNTQVHDRSEAFALMAELKKRQRPFEKLRLAQAHEEKYRAEAQSVETMMDTLESMALTETEAGVIPPEERLILKGSLYQAVRNTAIDKEALISQPTEPEEAIDLDNLKKLLFYPGVTDSPLADKGFLADLGTIIAHKLTEQLQHKQLIQQTFGLNQPAQDKLVLCKYLQQLLDEVQKLRTENESLTTQLNQYQPAGLGLYIKSIKKV